MSKPDKFQLDLDEIREIAEWMDNELNQTENGDFLRGVADRIERSVSILSEGGINWWASVRARMILMGDGDPGPSGELTRNT